MNATLTDAAIHAGQAPDPFVVFDAWLAEAVAAEINDPTAMALATVDASGMPDVRAVLLKGHDPRGFVFYTNLESTKAAELAAVPKAALLFHWKSLRRQVRVRGTVSTVTPAEADAYFNSRPRGSQIGAWASDQSRTLGHKDTLKARVAEREAEFAGDVPRPAHWSGFRVEPVAFEFWQDGAFRLHDRFLYRRDGEGWTVSRLYP